MVSSLVSSPINFVRFVGNSDNSKTGRCGLVILILKDVARGALYLLNRGHGSVALLFLIPRVISIAGAESSIFGRYFVSVSKACSSIALPFLLFMSYSVGGLLSGAMLFPLIVDILESGWLYKHEDKKLDALNEKPLPVRILAFLANVGCLFMFFYVLKSFMV